MVLFINTCRSAKKLKKLIDSHLHSSIKNEQNVSFKEKNGITLLQHITIVICLNRRRACTVIES